MKMTRSGECSRTPDQNSRPHNKPHPRFLIDRVLSLENDGNRDAEENEPEDFVWSRFAEESAAHNA